VIEVLLDHPSLVQSQGEISKISTLLGVKLEIAVGQAKILPLCHSNRLFLFTKNHLNEHVRMHKNNFKKLT
jgi:hypothetical protein